MCAVPRGFAVVARRRTDGMLRVVDARREQEVTLVPHDEIRHTISASPSGWRRYVSAVRRRLANNFPSATLGADNLMFRHINIPASLLPHRKLLLVRSRMGNEEYNAAVGGGLKLKGGKPMGVMKKKKKI